MGSLRERAGQFPWRRCAKAATTFWHAGKQARSVWPLTDWKVLRNQIRHSNVAHHVQFETGLASYQDKMPPVSSNSQAGDSKTKRRAKPRNHTLFGMQENKPSLFGLWPTERCCAIKSDIATLRTMFNLKRAWQAIMRNNKVPNVRSNVRVYKATL